MSDERWFENSHPHDALYWREKFQEAMADSEQLLRMANIDAKIASQLRRSIERNCMLVAGLQAAVTWIEANADPATEEDTAALQALIERLRKTISGASNEGYGNGSEVGARG